MHALSIFTSSSIYSFDFIWLLYSTGVDEAAKWWSAMISVAMYWLSGDEENSERCYSQCDAFPRSLQQSE